MTHPNAIRLEELVVGRGDQATKAHVASCQACTQYVAGLSRGEAAFAANEGAHAGRFVAVVQSLVPARENRGALYAGFGFGLAVAASVLLFFRMHSGAPTEGAVAMNDPTATHSVRFKGGLEVAAVVFHNGVQSRQTGSLSLEPDDQIRLEIALDHDVRLAAGVLADNGDWAELQPGALLSAGTHYSELSVTFDHEVPTGWILVGPDEAVARARKSREFHEVTAVRVTPKRL